MVNEKPNGADVIGEFFGTREGLAHQAGTALAEGIVKALDVSSLTRLLTNRSMAPGGEDGGISLPEIGVADSALAVDRGQGVPQALSAGLIVWSNKTADHQTGFNINGLPDPLFMAFRADK